MSRLILKLHPRWLAWYIDTKRNGVVAVSEDPYVNMEAFDTMLRGIYEGGPSEAVIEKPYVRLQGDQYRVIKDIEHIQRSYALLLWACYVVLGIKPTEFNPSETKRPSRDYLISEANVKLDAQRRGLSPLQMMCLGDCLVIQASLEHGHAVNPS